MLTLLELKETVDKHEIDLYKGKDANNPSITLRLDRLEGSMTRMESRDARIVAFLLAILLAVLVDIFKTKLGL